VPEKEVNVEDAKIRQLRVADYVNACSEVITSI
jgi:hypothetical protein